MGVNDRPKGSTAPTRRRFGTEKRGPGRRQHAPKVSSLRDYAQGHHTQDLLGLAVPSGNQRLTTYLPDVLRVPRVRMTRLCDSHRGYRRGKPAR